MSSNKTFATDASVANYLTAKASVSQHADCQTLITLMAEITGEPPVMWGPSIVGFGRYQYTYESGRSGESCLTGFAVRGREIVLYLVAEAPAQQELLSELGRHRIGKACLYLKSLADIKLPVLQQLIQGSVQAIKLRYPEKT
jgi:hypothetical protein